ncbi:MAG: helix-turn-helix domain-containing protein [Gemmatimonas sp.]|uniref:helix-turn-helix domain-containing protein n=1 Tax=Gemmatimonas sp. TaxID=1962908 RepID=UPI00391AD4A9
MCGQEVLWAYLNSRDAARYRRLSHKMLANLRAQGEGPAFRKGSARTVRYEQAALDAYVAQKDDEWQATARKHNAPACVGEHPNSRTG